jgi:hypothetical protein
MSNIHSISMVYPMGGRLGWSVNPFAVRSHWVWEVGWCLVLRYGKRSMSTLCVSDVYSHDIMG